MGREPTSPPASRIKKAIDANRYAEPGVAHVLLHTVCRMYFHTPWPKRAERLAVYKDRWPEIVNRCLLTCSQEGKPDTIT